ncbi:pilus assembly protein PilM [Candidatus Nomurabacteria bacterium]|nr:pilus assembly protein PilM [Candidatus Nomurabacteria bacterium]
MLDKLKNVTNRLPLSKKSDQLIVGLDIGTEFVKALIARVNGDELEVIGVGRAHQSLSDMQSGAISDIAGVVANCNKALTQAEDMAGVSPRQAVIGIAGELVKGITTTVKYRRPNPEKALDGAEIELIIDRAQAKTLERAQKQLELETGKKDVEVKLVNSAIVAMHIDTYKVSNPIGFQGKEVVIQLYTAFAPMVHIGALERTATELDLDLLAVAAEPFAVSRSLIGADASSNFTAILIDVGGGTTDIAVVDDGGVQGTKMFGIGGRAFTKSISSELDLDFKDAEKVKLDIKTDTLDEDTEARATDALKRTLEVWIDGVELALSEFTNVDHLPSKIYLCGGGASLALLTEELKKQNWYKDLPFTRKPIIELIDPDQVSDMEDNTGKVNDHTLITALGLLRVGYDTLIDSEDTSAKIKEKFNKILSI